MPVPEKHHPTPEERDERVSVPLTPDQFIEGVLAVDPDEGGKSDESLPDKDDAEPDEVRNK
jgi:hypothetical protein